MTVIWSGITEQGAVVPVQVDDSGRVIATGAVPDEYVLLSGDTMTGPLVLPGDPTAELQAATKRYVDNAATNPGTARAFARVIQQGSLIDSFGVRSVTLSGENQYLIILDEDLGSSAYVPIVTASSYVTGVTVNIIDGLSFLVTTFAASTGEPKPRTFQFVIFYNPVTALSGYAE